MKEQKSPQKTNLLCCNLNVPFTIRKIQAFSPKIVKRRLLTARERSPLKSSCFSFIPSPQNPVQNKNTRNCAFTKLKIQTFAAAKKNSSPWRRMKNPNSNLPNFAAAKTISSPGRSSFKSSEIYRTATLLASSFDSSIFGSLPWKQASSCVVLLRNSPIF